MAEKTLGEIAFEAYWNHCGPLTPAKWEAMNGDNKAAWEAGSDAVIAAHEARRWTPWPPCVEGELPDVVALDDPKLGRKFGFMRDRKWVDEDGVEIIEYGVPPERWTTIPAPPKEADGAA